MDDSQTQTRKIKWGGLDRRVFTGLPLFLAVVFLVLYAPLWALASAVAVVAGLAMWEYTRLAMTGPWDAPKAAGIVLAAAIVPSVLGGGGAVAAAMGLAILLATLIPIIAGAADFQTAVRRGVACAWGVLYTGGLFACLVMVAGLEHGRLLFLYAIVAVAAADVGAYFVGHFIGKRKLAPRISPGKTIEGGFGGLALAAVVGALYAWWFLEDTSPQAGALLAVGLAVLSIGGDLLESSIKRAAGAKDSGHILPGHGGVLDRVDGHLAAAPGLLLARMLWWG